MAFDFEYVSPTLNHPDESNVFPKRKPCFGWLSDDENSPRRYDITNADVKWILMTGESTGGSRSFKSPHKVRFSDDKQMLGSDEMNSRMEGKYSDDTNTRMGRKHSDKLNSRKGRKHFDYINTRKDRKHSDKMNRRMDGKHFDDVNSRMDRKHSDDMNSRMGRTLCDEMNGTEDRKHFLQSTQKHSFYGERASPCSRRGDKKEPGRKDWNSVQNHGRQNSEWGVCYDVKDSFHEWHYGQEDGRHTEKDESIRYNRRHTADMGHDREEQRGIGRPPRPHKSGFYVKEPAHLRNDVDDFNIFRRYNADMGRDRRARGVLENLPNPRRRVDGM